MCVYVYVSVSFENATYISGISHLSGTRYGTIFFRSADSLLLHCTESSEEQFFNSDDHAFGDKSKDQS